MTTALDVFGTEEPPPERRLLRAGPLTAVLEAGQLRDLRWHGAEALRGIAWLLRDAGWGTAALDLSNLWIEEAPDHFAVRYRLSHDGPIGALDAGAEIEGRADGTLRFAVRAAARRALTTNRLGFVVLHPDHAAGLPLAVGHSDGTTERTRFPGRIMADQPAFDILSLEHAPAPGVTARVAFEGGVWEMEDQRNWADASFKTYVRPLALPRPYVVPAGTTDAQAVTLTLMGEPRATAAAPIQAAPPTAAVPPLWLRLAEGHPLPEAPPLPGLAHGLIARLRVGRPDPLAEAASFARRHGLALAVEAVFPQRNPEAEARAALAALAGLPVEALLATAERDLRTRPSGRDPEGEAPLAATLAALRRHGWTARLGAGTPAFFTEFNRNPPPPADLAFFGGCSIVHAADDVSVMETVGVLPALLASAQALVPDVPLWPGPLALAPTVAPYSDGLPPGDGTRRLCMAERDPRHGALFGAAHLVGVLAACAGRAEAAAPLLLNGPSGLADAGSGPRPLAFVHAEVAAARGAPLRAATLERGLASLGWERAGRITTLVANLGDAPADVPVPPEARLDLLAPGRGGWRPAGPEGPLPPYATARWTAAS